MGQINLNDYYNGKHCSKCKQLKNYTEYGTNNRNKDKKNSQCKACMSNASRRSAIREWQIEDRYNIPLSIYTDIMNQAGDTCPLCKSTYTDKHLSKHSRVLDHCHATGKIRGVICNSCNKALGVLKDDTDTLERFISWLT